MWAFNPLTKCYGRGDIRIISVHYPIIHKSSVNNTIEKQPQMDTKILCDRECDGTCFRLIIISIPV